MIDLYAWPTPNSYKISIMLEETGLPYTVKPVNIGAGEQFEPDFLKISPNNRMPAIVDHDGPDGQPVSVFESGAILIYLAEKTGQFLPAAGAARYKVLEWVMWQMAGLGPMVGQLGHFRMAAPEKIPYALERYTNEAKRLFGVLDRQLRAQAFLAGDYSIADMISYPWTLGYQWLELPIDEFPSLQAWQARLAARPAVARGMELMADQRRAPGTQLDEKAKEVLYGKKQFERR